MTPARLPRVPSLTPHPRRLESTHQHLLGLWQQLHQDLRSLRSWQYLTRDIQQIQSWTHITVSSWGSQRGTGVPGVPTGADTAVPPQFRTLPAEEVRQVLRSLESHYQEFLRDSQDSQSFQPDDRLQVERDYNTCTHKYELLLRSQEKGGCPLSAFPEGRVSPGCPQGLSVRRSPWCPWSVPRVLSHPCVPPPHLRCPCCAHCFQGC